MHSEAPCAAPEPGQCPLGWQLLGSVWGLCCQETGLGQEGLEGSGGDLTGGLSPSCNLGTVPPPRGLMTATSGLSAQKPRAMECWLPSVQLKVCQAPYVAMSAHPAGPPVGQPSLSIEGGGLVLSHLLARLSGLGGCSRFLISESLSTLYMETRQGAWVRLGVQPRLAAGV